MYLCAPCADAKNTVSALMHQVKAYFNAKSCNHADYKQLLTERVVCCRANVKH